MSEFRAEAAQGRDELHRLRRHLRDLELERDEFQRRNKLKRTAVRTKSFPHIAIDWSRARASIGSLAKNPIPEGPPVAPIRRARLR